MHQLSSCHQAQLMWWRARAAICSMTPPCVCVWRLQVQKLHLGIPTGTVHGYVYMLISLASALALGLAIYGTAVWTL